MKTRLLVAALALAGASLAAAPTTAKASWDFGSAFSFSLSIGDGAYSSSPYSFGLFYTPTYAPWCSAYSYAYSSSYVDPWWNAGYDPYWSGWAYDCEPVFDYRPYSYVAPVRCYRPVYSVYRPFGCSDRIGFGFSSFGGGSFLSFSFSFGDFCGPRFRDDWRGGRSWRNRGWRGDDRWGSRSDRRDRRDGDFDGRHELERDNFRGSIPSDFVGPIVSTGPTRPGTRAFGDAGSRGRRPDAPPPGNAPPVDKKPPTFGGPSSKPMVPATKPGSVGSEKPKFGDKGARIDAGRKLDPVGPVTTKPALQPRSAPQAKPAPETKPLARPALTPKPAAEPNKSIVVGPQQKRDAKPATPPSAGRPAITPRPFGQSGKLPDRPAKAPSLSPSAPTQSAKPFINKPIEMPRSSPSRGPSLRPITPPSSGKSIVIPRDRSTPSLPAARQPSRTVRPAPSGSGFSNRGMQSQPRQVAPSRPAARPQQPARQAQPAPSRSFGGGAPASKSQPARSGGGKRSK